MEIEPEVDPVYEEIERERWGRINGNSSEIMQVSDLSDEDVKRTTTPSDMSRQSSRSYGDSRPLLPYYSQQQQQQLRQQQIAQQKQYHQQQQQQQFALSEERLRDFNTAQMNRDQEHIHRAMSQQQLHEQQQQQLQYQQQQQQHLSRENLMTVAVLNGEQVVCRLTSPVNHQPPTSVNSPQQLPHSQSGAIGGSNQSSGATSPASNGCPAHIVISRAPPHLVAQQQSLYNEC